jgi:predicted SAM-dependent methyltransferase
VSGTVSRRRWARPLLRLMPMEVWLELERQLRLLRLNAANAILPWRRPRRRRFARLRDVKLHLGSGDQVLSGWLNVDAASVPGVNLRQDLRRPLPLRDGSCRMIFCHHVLEHLSYPEEALALLRECQRLLSPAGWIRIVVPDLEAYARAYCGVEGHPPVSELSGPTEPLDLPGEQFSLGLWRWRSHKFAYDAETLAGLLQLAGFERVERRQFGESALGPELAQDRTEEYYRRESLYMEATPAA